MNKQVFSTLLAFLFGFLAIIGGLYVYRMQAPMEPPAHVTGLLWPNPKQITEFRLSDQHQQAFDLARVQGKWTLWYFGYTNCPDACPLAMTVMSGIQKSLRTGEDASSDVQYAFISVDPERDSLEHLGKYVGFFNPDIIAATGNDDALGTLTRQFGVLNTRQEPDADGNYLVDHTVALLLTDPEARFIGIFQQPHEVADISEQIRLIRSFVERL